MRINDFLRKFDKTTDLSLIITKVQFFVEENLMELIILSKEKLKENEENQLLEIFNDILLKLDLNIRLKNLTMDEYRKVFIDNIHRELAMCKDLSLDKVDIEDGIITIKLINKIVEKEVLTTKSYKDLKDKADYFGYKLKFAQDDSFNGKDLAKEKEKQHLEKIKSQIQNIDLNKKEKEKKKTRSLEGGFKYGNSRVKQDNYTPIEDLIESPSTIRTRGQVYNINRITTRKGSQILKFDLDNKVKAVECKSFIGEEDIGYFDEKFKEGMGLEVIGVYQTDSWDNSLQIKIFNMEEAIIEEKVDQAKEKRIEFNVHTKYTNLEGLVEINELFETLNKWGHEAVGLTDMGTVQAYPEAYSAAKKNGIKLNLGLEAKTLFNELKILTNHFDDDLKKYKSFTVFDIETTGLSRFNDKITEIGAVKIVDGEIIDTYQQLVNPEKLISEKITDLTGITNEMVSNQPKIDQVLPGFLDFAKDTVLVAHNADFDIGFIYYNAKVLDLDFKPIFMDTLWLARALNPDNKNHKLNTLAKQYGVSLLNHHRASDDAKATAEVFLKMLKELEDKNIDLDNEINQMETDFPVGKHDWHYNLIYVQNKIGLKNLYQIISESNMKYLNRTPGVPYFLIDDHRDGILVSAGGHKSLLFEYTALGLPDEVLVREAKKYDFIQVEPLGFTNYLIDNFKIKDKDHLIAINKKLYQLAKDLDKPIVATGNVYYLDENEYVYKNILNNYPRKRSVDKEGYFYLRDTNNMLREFSFMGDAIAKELVIDNPRLINDLIEDVNPIAEGTFTPHKDGAEEDLKTMTYEKAISIYGDPLPDLVKKRLDRELNSIISNGYAVLYIIAQDLVKKSNKDGYLVGSRGSVGSSFAATMSGITEVNPLEPHYICPNCKHSEFITDKSVGSGIDLPDKTCPSCGHEYRKDGHDIPFEVFLGFEGDKEPDIDLNFAGEYQLKIHKYTEELFGSDKVFRAGTIGTIADKTAYGMARKYKEFYPEDDSIDLDGANMRKIQRKIVGVKRTTGQHAGGLIIVPDNKEIEDFTPIQYPADDPSSGIKTTHFDYHSIEENLLKLDLLGHNVPSIIRMLSDQSGIDSTNIDMSDQETMSIFNSTESLNIKHDYSNIDSGTLGIPEFGTMFVRGMLKDTKPTTFSELVRISGLSHGTDVWLNNAQDLINKGVCELKDSICTRDDIMIYLIAKGMDKKLSFDIMEKVRKGRGITEDRIEIMRENNVPQWYIDSCNKIKYMFPKAHAVAYVMMSYRIAYFKVHHPEYFYTTYFTTKITDYQNEVMKNGLEFLQRKMKELKQSENFDKDINKYYVMEVGEEMYARGIELLNADIYKSHPTEFTVPEKNKILPPLMAVESVSQQNALAIAEARKDGEFISKEDFKTRTNMNKTAMASLEENGMFGDMQESNQLGFFDLL